jgi:hypothetical protein
MSRDEKKGKVLDSGGEGPSKRRLGSANGMGRILVNDKHHCQRIRWMDSMTPGAIYVDLGRPQVHD